MIIQNYGAVSLTRKYVCKAVLNENALLSVFFTFKSVERLFVFSVTCKRRSTEFHYAGMTRMSSIAKLNTV